MFSDERVFHLDEEVNVHNASHWFVNNHDFLIWKTIDLRKKTMVSAAIGDAGGISSFLFEWIRKFVFEDAEWQVI